MNNDKSSKLTCSKLVLFLVVFSYFLGLIGVTALIIWILYKYDDYSLVSDLSQAILIYIGGPVSIAIGFYEWKAKHENVLKITKGLSKEEAKDYYTHNSNTSDMISDDTILNNLLDERSNNDEN